MIRSPLHRRLTWMVCVSLAVLLAVPTLSPAQAQTPFKVTILVVDDFGSVDLATLNAEDFGAGESCAVSLEGQAFAVRGFTDDPIELSHGDLVMEQLDSLLSEKNASGAIDLIPVDIHGVSTDVAASRIASAVSDNPSDFYVINMSFGIIPCEYIEAIAAYNADLLNARKTKNNNNYRNLFKQAVIFYNGTAFPVMSQKAQRATDLDPIQEVLVSLGPQAVSVAAAGNFGLNFPFWPGAWGQVVSVSASTGTGYYAPGDWDKKKDTPLLTADVDQPGKQKRISNYGEVMMPGEYSSSEGVVSGTSFAAPRLSVALALYVAQVGSGFCRDSDGDPALAYGRWDNLTLQKAVNDYCPGMAGFMP